MKKLAAFITAIIAVVLFITMNTYTLYSYVDDEGYAMPTTDMSKVLLDANISNSKSVSLVKVSEKAPIYEQRGVFYAGENKQKVNLDYPMITRQATALTFIKSGAYLIDEDFANYATLEGMSVSGGHSFNADGKQADDTTFLLAQINQDVHMNVQKVNIKTKLESYDITLHSILHFEETFINAYTYKDGELQFLAIRGLQDAVITIGNVKLEYTDFLKKLQIIKEDIKQEEKKVEEKKEEIKKEEAKAKEDQTTQTGKETSKKTDSSKDKETGKDNTGEDDLPADDNDKPTDNKKPSKPGDNNGGETTKPTEPKPGKPEEGKPGESKPGGNKPGESKPGDDDSEDPEPGEDDKPGNGGNGQQKPSKPGEGDDDSGDEGDDDETPGEGGETPETPDYIAPEVNVGKLESWVYTVHTQLTLNDPMQKLYKGVKFTVYDADGKVIMRKQYRTGGLTEISILPPDKDLYIEGTYTYYKKDGTKETKTFLSLTHIKTLAIEGNVKPITINYTNHETTQPQRVRFDEMSYANTSEYNPEDKEDLKNLYLNTLPYIARNELVFTNDSKTVTTAISTDKNKRMMSGETIDVETGNVLESNQQYTLQILPKDRFGNLLPTQPESITDSVKTSKKTPSVKAKILENKAGNFELSLDVTDEDQALENDAYAIRILTENNDVMELSYKGEGRTETTKEFKISSKAANTTVIIDNLPFSQQLKVEAIGTYDTLNNEGRQEKKVIGSVGFYSASIVDGELNITTSFSDILGSSVTVNTELNQKSTLSLVSLLNEMKYTFKADGKDDISVVITKEQFNQATVEKDYDVSRKLLVIQKADREKGHPEIALEAEKKTFEKGMDNWQVFVNCGLFGSGDERSAKLRITLAENSLTPSTKYTMTLSTYANQGGITYELKNVISKNSFVTKKREPQVNYDDYFMAQDFIEFYGLEVKDSDGTIINGNYAVQLIEEDKVIQSEPLTTNVRKESIRFDNIHKGKAYKIAYVAEQYNDGSTSATLRKVYTFKDSQFIGGDGVQGNIKLEGTSYDYDKAMLSLDVSKIEKGKYLNSDGTMSDNKNYFVTDFIPNIYVGGNGYYIRDFGSGSKIICYYDKDKKYTGYTNYSGDTALTISSSYAYFRICGSTGYEDKGKIGLINYIDDQSADTSKPFTTGKSINSSGVELENENGACTDFIEIEEGKSFYLYFSGTMTAYTYNQNKQKNGTYTTSIGIANAATSNIKYLRFSQDNYEASAYYKLLYYHGFQKESDRKATIKWTLEDHSQFLKEGEGYQIKQSSTSNLDRLDYKEDSNKRYPYKFEQGSLVSINKTETQKVEENKAYRYELIIQYHGKSIVLDEVTFKTDRRQHFIRTARDFSFITSAPQDDYMVVNDIVEPENYNMYASTISGILDFQGHTVKLNKNTNNKIGTVSKTGRVQNLYLEMGANTSYFISSNSGVIDNLYLKYNNDRNYIGSFIKYNYGTIHNFIMHFENGCKSVTASSASQALLCYELNQTGVIDSGYLYIEGDGSFYSASTTTQSYKGVLVNRVYEGSIISNLYINMNLYFDYTTGTSAGVIYQQSSYGYVTIKNTFMVGDKFSYTSNNDQVINGAYSYESDPLFPTASIANKNYYQNVYLFSEGTKYNNLRSTYATKLSLYDTDWYTKNFSKDYPFEVNGNVTLGYYPRLDLSKEMEKYQPYIDLPKLVTKSTPELVDTYVTEQKDDYAEVRFKFTNPDQATIKKIEVSNIGCTISDQYVEGKFYIVEARLSSPKVFTSSYNVNYISYVVDNEEFDTNVTGKIQAKFYSKINDLNDWMRMRSNPTQNYRLNTDLDFSQFSNLYTQGYIATFTGELDGGMYDDEGNLIGMHIIRNIKPEGNYSGNGAIIGTLNGGTISNLRIDTFQWDRTNTSSVALIYQASNYPKIDNIHISNVALNGDASYLAVVVGNGSNATITNSSIRNALIKTTDKNYSNSRYIGGFSAYYGNISNCYAANINFDGKERSENYNYSTYIGGIAGYSANVENCYTTGKIDGIGNEGGIVGHHSSYYTLRNCWSNVKVESSGNNIGGIIGYHYNSPISCLSVGNITQTNPDVTSTHRISGGKASKGYNNYAYEKQVMTGAVNDIDDSEALLSEAELRNEDTYLYKIKLGDSFSYSGVSKGELPKLKSTEGELLPYQEPQYIQSSKLNVEVSDQDIVGSDYLVYLRAVHPGYKLTTLSIDGMTNVLVDEIKGETSDISTYKVTSNKVKSLDQYILRATFVNESDESEEEFIFLLTYKGIEYWDIDSIDTWQKVMAEHGKTKENFRITGKIDFSKVEKPVLEVDVRRLVGVSKEQSSFCNLKVDETSRNLINTVSKETRDLTFSNISITHSNTANYIGVIGQISGLTVQNVRFKDISISINTITNTGSYYIGPIGSLRASLNNVMVENIKITENLSISEPKNLVSYTGGICGYASSVTFDNVSTTGIQIEMSKQSRYIGGLIGDSSGTVTLNGSLTIKPMSIQGGSYVGGIIGYIDGATYIYANIKGINVKGNMYVGGIGGYQYGSFSSGTTNQFSQLDVTGESYVGGITGAIYLNYSTSITKCVVFDSVITATENGAGGIVGRFNGSISNSSVINTRISAKNNGGGIVGESYNSNVYSCGVLHTDIRVSNKGAGGIAGMVIADTNNYISYSNDYLKDSSVYAEIGDVGGCIGVLSQGYIRGFISNNNEIESVGSNVGGIVGSVSFLSSPKYPSTIDTSYISKTRLTGSKQVGGAVGSIQGNAFYGNITASEFRGILVDADITSATDTPRIFSDRHHLAYKNAYLGGLKVLDTTTLNGKQVSTSELQTGLGKEALITEKELSDKNLYKNVSVPTDGSKAGLEFVKGSDAANYNMEPTYDIEKFDFTITPVKKETGNYTHTYLVEAIDLADGTYPLEVKSTSGVLISSDMILIKDHKGTVSVYNKNSSTSLVFTIDSKLSSTIVLNGSNYSMIDFSLNQTYYSGDIEPTITLPESNYSYTWYRSFKQSYSSSDRVLVGSGNKITLYSRGYYFAYRSDGCYSAIITADTFGYLPFSGNSTKLANTYSGQVYTSLPYQEGFTDDIYDNEHAISTTDRVYMEGVKIFSTPIMETKVETTTRKKEVALPNVEAYASDVDTLNLEFAAEIPKGLKVELTCGNVKKSYDVKDQVMTLGYHYQQDISATISLGTQKKTYTWKANDLQHSISVYKQQYYYLTDDGISFEKDETAGDFVHLFKNLALNKQGNIIDLDDASNAEATSELEHVSSKSLQSVIINNQQVDAYQGISYVDQTVRNMRMIIKRDQLFLLDGELKTGIGNFVVDTYGEERIFAILNEEGKLENITGELNLPEGFKNANIKEISCNIDSDSSIVLVRYQNGDLKGFDYITGKEVDIRKTMKEESFIGFIKSSFFSMFDHDETVTHESNLSKAEGLIQQLEQLTDEERSLLDDSVYEDEFDTNTSQGTDHSTDHRNDISGSDQKNPAGEAKKTKLAKDYVEVFESKTQTFTVYHVNDLVNSKAKAVLSEEKKIEKAKAEGKKIEITTGVQKASARVVEDKQGITSIYIIISLAAVAFTGLLVYKRYRTGDRKQSA